MTEITLPPQIADLYPTEQISNIKHKGAEVLQRAKKNRIARKALRDVLAGLTEHPGIQPVSVTAPDGNRGARAITKTVRFAYDLGIAPGIVPDEYPPSAVPHLYVTSHGTALQGDPGSTRLVTLSPFVLAELAGARLKSAATSEKQTRAA